MNHLPVLKCLVCDKIVQSGRDHVKKDGCTGQIVKVVVKFNSTTELKSYVIDAADGNKRSYADQSGETPFKNTIYANLVKVTDREFNPDLGPVRLGPARKAPVYTHSEEIKDRPGSVAKMKQEQSVSLKKIKQQMKRK